jgi:hypothetical protein
MDAEAKEAIWSAFDEALTKAQSPDIQALIAALKAHGRLTDARLHEIEHGIGLLIRAVNEAQERHGCAPPTP